MTVDAFSKNKRHAMNTIYKSQAMQQSVARMNTEILEKPRIGVDIYRIHQCVSSSIVTWDLNERAKC